MARSRTRAAAPATPRSPSPPVETRQWAGPAALEPLLLPIDALVPDPANARTHDPRNIDAIRGSLRRFGQVKPIVLDASGVVRAGNGTLEAARREGWTHLAAVGSGLTGAEATAYGLIDNRSSDLSAWDDTVLAAHLDSLRAFDPDLFAVTGFADAELDSLLESLAEAGAGGLGLGDGEEEPRADDPSDPVPGPQPPTPNPHPLFPSSNEWGIPDLDPDLQAAALVQPVTAWGSVARCTRMPGTWHFYVHDYRFEALRADPSAVVDTGAAAAVEPNFSTFAGQPAALALWQTYWKRWIARSWQARGLRVWVDLNCGDSDPLRRLNLLGVPSGWQSYATRAHRETGPAGIEADHAVAVAHAGTAALRFLVIGGGRDIQALAAERGWLWVPENSDAARGRLAVQGA